MIVNKPQFDVDKIKPGQAYWLVKKDYRNYFEINTPAIVVDVSELNIILSYFHKDNEDIKEISIHINAIVDKTVTLEPMKVVKVVKD